MYRENSWDDSKQRLEELFKLTSFDRFVANGSVEVIWNNSAADDCFERSRSNGWQFFPMNSLSRSKEWQFFSNW